MSLMEKIQRLLGRGRTEQDQPAPMSKPEPGSEAERQAQRRDAETDRWSRPADPPAR